MKLALVGSLALEPYVEEIHLGDCDFICYPDDFKKLFSSFFESDGSKNLAWMKPTEAGMAVAIQYPPGDPLIYDAEFVGRDNPSSRLVYDHIISTGKSETWLQFGKEVEIYYADLNTLYLLKMSHRYKKNSPHFLKTMEDIHLLRELGAEIDNEELYKARMEATYEYSHPNLRRTKEEFFTTNGDLVYEYDHDSLHEAVAHRERPMYTFYAVDGEQVLSDRNKFEALSLEDRYKGVLEEAYVLALERSVIPFDEDPDQAFFMALEKVCTSITSGWFREFAWEKYYQCLNLYNSDYVEKFRTGIEKGIVIKL